MRTYALLLPLLILTAIGQEDIWGFLPTCAQPCATNAADANRDCLSTDYTCLCNSSDFQLTMVCCVRSNCDASEDDYIFDESQTFCSDLGVYIPRLPDSDCTTTYGSETATAAATATGLEASETGTAIATATGLEASESASAASNTGKPSTMTSTITIASGQVSTVTITYAAATETSTSTSAESSNDGNSSSSDSSTNCHKSSCGLSTGAKIGIGVGAGVGGLALIGGIIARVVYCCTRRRKSQATGTTAASTAYTSVDMMVEQKPNDEVTALYSDHKPELDSAQQQQFQPQPFVSSLYQQQQQHNPAAVPGSALPAGLAGPISPVSDHPSTTETSELHSQSQGYYHSPDGGAQEMNAMAAYQSHQRVVTQAEMPNSPIYDQHYTRYELQ